MYITCELNQYREEMLKLLGLSTRDEKARGGVVIVCNSCFILFCFNKNFVGWVFSQGTVNNNSNSAKL